ncbi:MAG: putative ABC transporter permease subunit [Clostridia bacterium]|jgi:ABC-2 type transport system permease protein
MKTLWLLLKIHLNVNFGISALKYRFFKEKKRRWEPLLIGAAILFGGGIFVLGYSFSLFALFMAGSALNQPEIMLTMAFLVIQFIVLFFGFFYIMSAFYFSRDLNILLPLPLKPYQVMGSKFVVILINEYLTIIPMLLPALIIYGTGTHQGFFYWIKGLLLMLLSPMIPLTLIALIIVILMRFINFRKSKDLWAVLGGMLAILFGVGINFFTQRIPTGQEREFFENILRQNSGLVNLIGEKFPPSLWATYSLSRPGWEGFGYFILFIGLSFLLFFVLLWMGNQLFYKSFLSGQEVGRKKRALSHEELKAQSSRVSSPVLAVFHREWRLFIREPLYAMNGFAGMIMMPFLLMMPLLSGQEEMSNLLRPVQNPDPSSVLLITLIGAGIMLFVTSINIVACTAVSREGATFWVSKTIPLSPSRQVMGKLLHAMAISMIGVIVTSIPVYVVLRPTILRFSVILLISLPGILLINLLNLMVDVLRPKLEWNNPQEAVKQNMNGLLGMLASVAVIVILGGLAFLLFVFEVPKTLIYLILFLVTVLLNILAYKGLLALAEYRYKQIEI